MPPYGGLIPSNMLAFLNGDLESLFALRVLVFFSLFLAVDVSFILHTPFTPSTLSSPLYLDSLYP